MGSTRTSSRLGSNARARAEIEQREREERSQRRAVRIRRSVRACAGLALVTGAAAGLLYGTWILARDHGVFALRRVEVKGLVRLSESDVAAAAGLRTGMDLFSLDLDSAELRLAAHPWIRSAEVSRRFTRSVVVAVEEEVAEVVAANGVALSAGGRILPLAGDSPEVPALSRKITGKPGAIVADTSLVGRLSALSTFRSVHPAAWKEIRSLRFLPDGGVAARIDGIVPEVRVDGQDWAREMARALALREGIGKELDHFAYADLRSGTFAYLGGYRNRADGGV